MVGAEHSSSSLVIPIPSHRHFEPLNGNSSLGSGEKSHSVLTAQGDFSDAD